MFRTIIAAAAACVAMTAPAFAAPCTGVDLAIASVSVKNVSTSGAMNRYEITGTATNVGSSSQAASALQSVDVYQGSDKLDSISISPLEVGKSQPFSYTFSRAKDAGQNTTHLRFQLNGAHPAMADSQSCNMVNDSFTLTF